MVTTSTTRHWAFPSSRLTEVQARHMVCGHPAEGVSNVARVLSSDQAKDAVQQVQAIINGGLTEQISKLDAQGKILSDPNVWDGPLAQQFRDQTWPQTKSALDRAKQELDQLREQLQRIAADMSQARGGN